MILMIAPIGPSTANESGLFVLFLHNSAARLIELVDAAVAMDAGVHC